MEKLVGLYFLPPMAVLCADFILLCMRVQDIICRLKDYVDMILRFFDLK